MGETTFQPKDYGEKSAHLWRVCGRFTIDEVVDIEDATFLRFLGRDGSERCVICGPNAITINAALDSARIPHRTWIRVGSMAVLFEWKHLTSVKAELDRLFGLDRKFFALDCTRSSIARAMRGYRQRRDAMLSKGAK